MENGTAFYKFIDKTIYRDLMNTIVTTAVLCDYKIEIFAGTNKKEKRWILFIHKNDFQHKIGFVHIKNVIIKCVIMMHEDRINNLTNESEILNKLKELLEVI